MRQNGIIKENKFMLYGHFP